MRETNQIITFDAFELDPHLHTLRRNGDLVSIHATPLRVLLYLVENRPRAVAKHELLEHVWPSVFVGENALTSAICELRAVLEDDGRSQRRIRTERGRGYAFVADVETAPALRSLESIASVAVLPFVDMSSEGNQAYLVDGLTEEIIHELSQVPYLQVVSRTSVFALAERRADARELGCQLGVGTIIEGSLRTANPRARVTAQMIRAGDGYHVWSGTFDRALEDVLDFEEEIARAVCEAVLAQIPCPLQSRDPSPRRVPPRSVVAMSR